MESNVESDSIEDVFDFSNLPNIYPLLSETLITPEFDKLSLCTSSNNNNSLLVKFENLYDNVLLDLPDDKIEKYRARFDDLRKDLTLLLTYIPGKLTIL
jgi:hypothetical protein